MPTFLDAAFSAIPHVLGDTRALIAYVVAVVGWTAVALKVQRNKNLLSHLQNLPENARLQALQMEMGSVPVPAGITPTQYLKARTHTYYFWAFVILCVLLGSITALAIAYRPASVTTMSKALQDAMEAERQRNDLDAPKKRIREAEAKIEALELRRIPDSYLQDFGQPADKGKGDGVTYFVWRNDIYELDMSFVNGRSTAYCVTSQTENFKPKVPGTDIRLGEKALAELADTYLYYNYGSAGGSTVIRYGLNGSHAEDYLNGFVANAGSPSQYPPIKGADQLARLKPANKDAGTDPVDGTDPINAFAVNANSEEIPACLQLPLWEPWN